MTLHEICVQASHVPCVCGARPYEPCQIVLGTAVYCLPRVEHTHRAGLVGMDDVAYIIRNFLHAVPDPERIALAGAVGP